MSKKKFQIVLIVAMLLLAGGTSAHARGVAPVREKAQVTRIAKQTPSFWQWIKIRLTRYAMAAN